MVAYGARCMEEEGHDTGVGTPHSFPPSGEDAARELTARLGIPCTALPLAPVREGSIGDPWAVGLETAGEDAGDVTCATADDTPEGALAQMFALGAAAETMDADMSRGMLAGIRAGRQRRVRDAVVTFLRDSEGGWSMLHRLAAEAGAGQVVEDAKHLRDAELAELFVRIGEAL